MACGDYSDYGDALVDGALLDAVTCPFIDVMGAVVFPVMFFAPVAMGLYIMTRRIEVPLVVAIIGGAVIVTQLPAVWTNAILFVLVVGLAAGAFWATMRLKRE